MGLMNAQTQTSPLLARIIPVTPFQQNCSLVWCTQTLEAAFIDPGGEIDKLMAAVKEQGVTLTKIFLTHGHLDHAGAANAIRTKTGVTIEGPHRDDQFLLDELATQGARYGFSGSEAVTPDRWLVDGDSLTLGTLTFGVTHCPGHTPGHVVIWHGQTKLAFVGDVLFKGSIGRTDLPRGNFDQLITSITEGLWPLGDGMNFVPGHGPMSTFGFERRTNPFVSDIALGRN
jgi:hydroxyacylglutathione hydrolase